MPARRITPIELRITEGSNELYFSENSDLSDLMATTRPTWPRLPINAEGGYVLIALDCDGGFDEVVVAPPTGSDRSHTVEMMLSARDAAHEVYRALDYIGSGKEVPSLYNN